MDDYTEGKDALHMCVMSDTVQIGSNNCRAKPDQLASYSGKQKYLLHPTKFRISNGQIGSCKTLLRVCPSMTLAVEQDVKYKCGFKPRYRQIHTGLDDHLEWQSSVIRPYPQWQAKEPQGR